MSHRNVEISEPAFAGFQSRAAALGLSVEEYLNDLGASRPAPDGFVMTPELRSALREGIAEADRRELVTLDQSRADLERFNAARKSARPSFSPIRAILQ